MMSPGHLVRNLLSEHQTPGDHASIRDGRSDRGTLVPSGTYFYAIKIGELVASKPMTLLK